MQQSPTMLIIEKSPERPSDFLPKEFMQYLQVTADMMLILERASCNIVFGEFSAVLACDFQPMICQDQDGVTVNVLAMGRTDITEFLIFMPIDFESEDDGSSDRDDRVASGKPMLS